MIFSLNLVILFTLLIKKSKWSRCLHALSLISWAVCVSLIHSLRRWEMGWTCFLTRRELSSCFQVEFFYFIFSQEMSLNLMRLYQDWKLKKKKSYCVQRSHHKAKKTLHFSETNLNDIYMVFHDAFRLKKTHFQRFYLMNKWWINRKSNT